MKTTLLVAASLALVTFALPVAAADHTYNDCMNNIWRPAPPPGWNHFCSVAAWTAHNPATPIVSCLGETVIIIGIEVEDALECLA